MRTHKICILAFISLACYAKEGTTAQRFGYSAHLPTVVIDAGHGGKDQGHQNGKVVEKHITLSLACALARRLQKTERCNIMLTRTHDVYMETSARLKSALRHYATCYISLHANHSPNPNIRGALVYHTQPLEAHASQFFNAQHINTRNNILADTLTRHLKNSVIVYQEEAPRVPKSPLSLLPCASVTVSAGYISNPQESIVLQKQVYIRALANILATAIEEYLSALGL